MLPGIKQFRLDGKVAIVTGGSKGLGLAMAEGLASAGAAVALVSRHVDEAAAAAEQVSRDYGVRAIGIGADVTDNDAVKRMVDRTIGQLGRVDILINNAGINIRGPIDELTYEEFKQVQEINVNGPWLCARAVVPFLKEQKWGRIINLSSTLGVVGLANRTPYATSKGAVHPRAGPRARPVQHHGQRHLSRAVPDRHERADCPHRGGQKIHRGRCGAQSLGKGRRDPGGGHLPGVRCLELCDRQPAHG
jgi:hypothetical protein